MVRLYLIRKIGFDWEANKRLIQGSLVCLWNAQENIVILATVAQSDPEELEKGQITLAVDELPPGLPHDFQRKYYAMLECDYFYEPYRAMMEAYQDMTEDNVPLKDFLLGWNKTAGVPGYLEPNNNISAGHYSIPLASGDPAVVSNVMDLSTWPSSKALGVNEIQRKALHAAATRRVALIQGPPGTGKTFVGRRIIQLLLANKRLWSQLDEDHLNEIAELKVIQRNQKRHMFEFWQDHGHRWTDKRCPIVVICLTNQALDQFLEGIHLISHPQIAKN